MLLRVALTALIALSLTGCDQPRTGMAIENVTVIDPVDGAMSAQRVVVDGSQILSVASMSEPAPAVAQVLDAQGQYLIPGLWDMHVHFLYDSALTHVMADLFLDYGITSVRDTGGNLEQMVALTQALAAAPTPAPSVYFSGPLLDGPFVVYDGGDPGRPQLGSPVPDEAAARQTIRNLSMAGAHFIKIYELVDPAVFRALAAAARAQGMPIASHVPLMMTADHAGPLADSMEHLRNLELACAANWEELLETRRARIGSFTEGRGYDLRSELHSLQRLPAIAAYDEARCDGVLQTLGNTIQVPTLRLNTVATVLPFNDPGWSGALSKLPEPVRPSWQSRANVMRDAAPLADHTFAEWSLFLISRLQANGVPIGAGTDTPIGLGIPGWSLHTELALLVQAGLTPLEALHAATVQAASFFRLEETVGRIQPGMNADLLLLDADPLKDITNTRRIDRVMVGGQWVR
jgi:hypothetical protein